MSGVIDIAGFLLETGQGQPPGRMGNDKWRLREEPPSAVV
jgi:hypothetical protein